MSDNAFILTRSGSALHLTRGRHSVVLLFAAFLYLSACDAASDPRVETVRDAARDSAGVAIFQLRGEDEAPVAEISAPNDPIGADGEVGDDALFFHLVEGARRLDDNRIAVANRGTNEIIIVDSLGRRLGTIGRAGRGPGEFVRLASILRAAGDTLVALDGQLRRFSLLTANGGVVRDYVVQPPARASIMGLADAVGIVEDGQLVMWLQTMPSDEEIERLNQPNILGQIPLILFTVDSTGATTSVIGEFTGVEMWLGSTLTPSGERVASNWGLAPFGHWTGFGVHNDRIYVLRSAERGFSVYAPDGRLLSIYRGAWPVMEVGPDARRRSMDEWAGRYPSGPIADARRKELELVDYPATMPAYRDAVVGSDGIVWIEPYTMWDGERRHYVGYDSTGLAIGKLSLDYEDRIMEIGNGEAILLNRAEYGMETIRLARFHF